MLPKISGVEVAPCLLPKISGVEVTPSVTSVESSEQFWRKIRQIWHICEPCISAKNIKHHQINLRSILFPVLSGTECIIILTGFMLELYQHGEMPRTFQQNIYQ